MKPMLISLFAPHPCAAAIAKKNTYEVGKITIRDFPDGETYIKFDTSVKNKEIIILNSLHYPNPKILPLLFVAETAKKLGAKRIGLCAPYLAYMRQDKQFHPGEGITSEYFAALLSHYFDWLVTIDPHLHRHHNLNEIYSIPSSVLHATSSIAQWVAQHIQQPLLIGPDEESEQWVKDIAHQANAPYIVLEKIRHGDRDVEVSSPDINQYRDHTPILIDDIISTARTMIETIQHLKQLKMKPAVCIGVHAVFADNAYDALLHAGVAQIVSCNTIAHSSNQIDLSTLLAHGIQQQLI